MSITLSNGAASIALDPDLIWVNEFQWTPVEQSTTRTITGALLVDVGVKVGGRPLVLQGEEGSAWTIRADAKALLDEWVSLPGHIFTLTHNGQARQVIFDHAAMPFECRPVVDYSDPIDADYYCNVILRFFEV